MGAFLEQAAYLLVYWPTCGVSGPGLRQVSGKNFFIFFCFYIILLLTFENKFNPGSFYKLYKAPEV